MNESRQTRTSERGVQRAGGPSLKLADEEIMDAQHKSKLIQKLIETGLYRGMKIEQRHGLILIDTAQGKRVILPPELWAVAFKEHHDSVWAGHLRAPHTYARIGQVYWWPDLQQQVRRWVRGCQDCGSRKARPRQVIPPLRSIRGGDVGDTWVLDVAGPLPTGDDRQRHVLAAVEYVTRYAVAVAVRLHTAEEVTKFLMQNLVELLQAQQTNPVPYRPQMAGLVERFHWTWKNCVSTYMNDAKQHDWDVWVDFAVYAYNSAAHAIVKLSPNALMMGRRLRNPNELLRTMNVTEAGELNAYHRRLLKAMTNRHEWVELARAHEQVRQAKYYNRKAKRTPRTFSPDDRVWMFRPPGGQTIEVCASVDGTVESDRTSGV
ncbi:unnamed protein product [Phytophthora fragariaefolia]|uniref:Unnamed protein product n=1 Tax=Phytophthora fragariaefolia TaxID=1490495 RepID=A0A9W6Y114_9STRA|nr:unnamed protein product [Phytophthora fragariaefolia]